jgi:thiol-disulfide isomerase/thioredoxin
MLLLDYLDLATAMRDSSSRERTAAMRREAIAQIPPSSRLWSLDEQWLVNLMWGMTRDEGDASLLWPYLDRFEREQPDEQLRAEILYRTVEMGMQVNDAEAERRATAALATLGSKYPTSNGAQVALERFGGTSLRDGEMIPNFTFVSIDDPAVIFTRESMLGKTYLLDLWATWCGPCIGELPTLTSAYESYKPKGFEILSISFDASPDDVKAFRGKKWKMPWLHTFSPGGFSSSAARLFNVKGIPKTFLVGPDGRIIATDVRGEALASILAHTLAPERELPPGTQH